MANRRAPAPEERPARRHITAAARRVDIGASGPTAYKPRARAEQWQNDAWAYFDILGEVKQGTYLLANVVSLVRLFVGYQPDPEQDPVQAPDGMLGVAEAVDALARLEAIPGGHGGMLREFTANAKVAGEMYLVGWPETPEEPERWEVCSVSEIRSAVDGKYTFQDSPNAKPIPLRDDVLLVRLWLRHPEYSALADAPMRGVLEECEALMILTRAVKATGLSRLATAGILAMSNELDVDEDESTDDDDTEDGSFEGRFMQAGMTAIQNQGTAAAALPIIVRGPLDQVKDGIRHLSLDRPLEPEWREQRKELTERIAHGLDIPTEWLSGMERLNHWSTWQVDLSTWTRFGQPTVHDIVEGLTVGYLRPALESAGIDRSAADQLMVWFDPAGAIVTPDRSQTGKEAHDRIVISDEAYRTELGYSDADAPDDAEVQRRIEIAQAMRGPAAADANTIGNDPGRTPQGPPAANGAASISGNGNGHALPALIGEITAAGRHRDPLGKRLAKIDRDLRNRLEAMADAAMLRALERAGLNVRNRAKKDRNLREAVATVTASLVPAHLGAAVVAALGVTDDELLADAFASFGPRFDAKVSQAQDRVRRELAAELGLDDEEIAALERRQESDRSEAWGWLAGALATLATQRLYDPSPTPPAVGELSSSSVPPGMIREALARAGGDVAGVDPGGPMGGVALGSLVMDTFAAHGQVVSGWRWIHGDADRPFPPHEDLDGEEFPDWSDDVLAVGDDAGPVDGDFYHPGDHAGCSCDFEPLGLGESESEPVAIAAGARRDT